jgi:hypothetical protein
MYSFASDRVNFTLAHPLYLFSDDVRNLLSGIICTVLQVDHWVVVQASIFMQDRYPNDIAYWMLGWAKVPSELLAMLPNS